MSRLLSVCIGAVVAVGLGVSSAWAQSLTLESVYTDVLGFGAGSAVAVSGNYAVVGNIDAFVSGVRRGRATVFQRQGTSWTGVATLVASDGAANDRFGWTVAIKGDTIAVGADSHNGQRGAVYVFTRSGATWTQTHKLVASDAAALDRFGGGVSVDTGLIAVGAPSKFNEIGATYVFEGSGTAWTERRITNPNIQDSFFGQGVDLSGSTLCVSTATGANQLYIRAASNWVLQQTVQNPGASRGICRVDGDTAIVGGNNGTFVHVRAGTTWSLQQELTVANPVPGTSNSTDISGDVALLGMKGSTTVAGAVYVFARTGSTWALTRTVADAGPNALFGRAVAIDTETAVVGASVSTYLYRRSTGVGSGAPGAPTNFQASANGNTVSLSWGAPASGGAPTGYTVVARTTGGASLGSAAVGAATSLTVPGVPNGVFVLSALATNASGPGPESPRVTVTLPNVPPPPGPPTNLAVSVAGSTASFAWSAPTSGGPVASYRLIAGSTPGFTRPLGSLPLPPAPASVALPGIPPGTFYIRLVAENGGGASAASNEVAFTVAGPSAPAMPTLNAPVVTGRTVTLSWAPGSGGGAPTSYVLNVTGAVTASARLTGTTITVPGVPSGTYFLRLVAVNGVGSSPPSAQVTLVVP